MLTTSLRRWIAALTERRALAIVAVVAAALHLLALGGIPIMVTPDGQKYLTHAFVILGETTPPRLFAWDAPGYPLYLAGWFSLLGITPAAVLVAQHALGVVTAVCVAGAAAAVATPAVALLVGVLAALDPWAFLFTNYVLTEPLAAALLSGALWVTLARGEPTWRRMTAAGLLLGAAMITRPACAAAAPFIVLALALQVPRRLVLRTLAVTLGAAVGTQLVARSLNPIRSPGGFVEGASTILYMGAGMFGMIDRADIPDASMQRIFDRNQAHRVVDERQARFIEDVGAYDDAAAARRLGAIALRSIVRQPVAYLRNATLAGIRLLNAGREDNPPMHDELAFLARRLGWDGRVFGHRAANFQGVNFDPPLMRRFVADHQPEGAAAWYLTLWGKRELTGFPHVPLVLLTLAGILLAARRRLYVLAAAFAAPIALIAAHAMLLAAITRYASPAIPLMYVAAAFALHELVRGFWHRRGTGTPGCPSG